MTIQRLSCAVIAFSFLLTSGCHTGESHGSTDTGLAEVTVAKPKVEKVIAYEYFTGRTAAIPVVEIRARVNGYLDQVFFKDGQEVEKGAKLYEVDPRPYKSEVDRLTAMVSKNKAGVVSTSAELGRQKQLIADRATSQADFDKATGIAGEAAGALAATQADLEKAKLDLDFCTVTSPIAGRMSSTQIDPGNLVVADKTLLTTVVAVDPIYVEFNVDERTVLEIQQRIREKQVKSTSEAGVPVWISLATDGTDFPYEGKIDFIDNRVNTSTGTLKVRAQFENPIVDGQRRFTPGLFVRIKLPVTDPRPSLLVADRAIDSDLDQKFVYVVNDQKKVERRPIKLGPLKDGMRIVEPVPVIETKQGSRPAREGEKGLPSLKEGEWVVVSGLQFVTQGASVNPIEGKMD
jgi:RND family efflux transporter MFP subunit